MSFSNKRDVFNSPFNKPKNKLDLDFRGGDDEVSLGCRYSNINLGSGNDQITLVGNYNTIHAGSGNDTLDITGAFNTVYLDNGRNIATVNGGNSTIYDGWGSDIIEISGYNNQLIGGYGSDVVTLKGNNNVIDWFQSINMSGGPDMLYVHGKDNLIKSMDNMIFVDYDKTQTGTQVTNIRGQNDVTIITSNILAGQKLAVKTWNGDFGSNKVSVIMKEGKNVLLSSQLLSTAVSLVFGDAGSDKIFKDFYLDIQALDYAPTTVNITSPQGKKLNITPVPGTLYGSPAYQITSSTNDPSAPTGYILVSRRDSPVSFYLDNVFRY